jgi:two-component system response regulator DctR
VVKEGAADFFEKPFSDNLLVDRIYEVLNVAASARAQRARERDTRERYDSLSSREREVAALIVEGKLNKVIAHELAIAERTVEVHRSRIFSKMDVRSAVELTKVFSSVLGLVG